MSLKHVHCPSCNQSVPFDTKLGTEQRCASCDGLIRLVSKERRTSRRSGVRFGETVYGVNAREGDEDAPEPSAATPSLSPRLVSRDFRPDPPTSPEQPAAPATPASSGNSELEALRAQALEARAEALQAKADLLEAQLREAGSSETEAPLPETSPTEAPSPPASKAPPSFEVPKPADSESSHGAPSSRGRRRTGVRFGDTVYGVEKSESKDEADPVPELPEFAARQSPDIDFIEEGEGEMEFVGDEKPDSDELAEGERRSKVRSKRSSKDRKAEKPIAEEKGAKKRRTTSSFRKRKFMYGLVAALVLVSSVAVWLYLDASKDPTALRSSSVQSKSGRLAQSRGQFDLSPEERLKEAGSQRAVDGAAVEAAEPDGAVFEVDPEAVSATMVTLDEANGGVSTDQRPGIRRVNALEVAKKFLEANSIEERLGFVRNPEQAAPLMVRYFKDIGDGPIRYKGISLLVAEDVDPRYVACSVQLEDGPRMMGVEVADDGYFVDWDSFALMSEMDWKEFMEKKPSTPALFRVSASVDDYYNFGFEDEEKWLCLRMVDPKGLERTIYGYAARDSVAASEILKVKKMAGEKTMPLVVRLRFPVGGKADNQVFISEFVSNGWMLRSGAGLRKLLQ